VDIKVIDGYFSIKAPVKFARTNT